MKWKEDEIIQGMRASLQPQFLRLHRVGWSTVLGLEDLGWNFCLVLTVDATPDTRELECNEIKTQVELATGQLGLRRAAQEHSFPQMLHQVGLSTSNQPGSRPLEVARSSAYPRGEGSKPSKEASSAGAGECLASLHWSLVGLTSVWGVHFCSKSTIFGGGGLVQLKWPSVSASNIPQSLPLERTGPLPPGKLLPWRTVSNDVSVSMGLGGETLRAR